MLKRTTWQVWIDTGGTFTDGLAKNPEGHLLRTKVLSNGTLRGKLLSKQNSNHWQIQASWHGGKADLFTGYTLYSLAEPDVCVRVLGNDPSGGFLNVDHDLSACSAGMDFVLTAYEEAPILATRLMTQTTLSQALPPLEMRLGSTKGTNGLLERKGSSTGLLITAGFSDLLAISTQQRPDIFALNIQKAQFLYEQVIEVNERLDAQGSILKPLESNEIGQIVTKIQSTGIRNWAIALLHSYRNPIHEQRLRDALLSRGITWVSCSSELFPTIKLLPRAQTAVVNAYLTEVIQSYLNAVLLPLAKDSLRIMTSAGGLTHAALFQPKDSLLSGPAGGVVGAAYVARLSNITQLLTLDMGGTSTDVARFAKQYEYQFESSVGDAHLFSPSLAIETVAAGGGSICQADGLRLFVGPESAGAAPGPACYGANGPLTITDVNLLLGRLDPSQFGIPLHEEAAKEALIQVKTALLDHSASDEEVLQSFLDIANERMAEAIRKISVRKGYNPSEYTLLAFGGAGGQHACGVAQLLNIPRILIPYDAGLLSAYGMGKAVIERFATKQVLQPLDTAIPRLDSYIADTSIQALELLAKEGISESETAVCRVLLYMRLLGQDTSLEIAYENRKEDISGSFRRNYKTVYGHWIDKRPIELESIKVIASTLPPDSPEQAPSPSSYIPQADRTIQSYQNGGWISAPVFRWETLRPGASITGPALVTSQSSTTVVDTGWHFALDGANNAILVPAIKESKAQILLPESAHLELFTNRFRAMAEEMGALLQRTAFSVNVKERLDFSCAILDSTGELIVNAPHVPVHLGSLGVCVRKVAQALPIAKGDVIITNHPGFGGSHLPDITLISPVYGEEDQLVGYVANRAHHAEIGGKRPGSMPPDATCLAEEGVVIAPTYLIKRGQAQWAAIEEILTQSPYPTRSLSENLADLNAALASIQVGVHALTELVQKHTADRVKHYMHLLKEYAADRLRTRIKLLPSGKYDAEEFLDDGTWLKVQVEVIHTMDLPRLRIDFSGTAAVHPGNLNATPAIVQSVILYVLRLIIQEDIPLNEGLMQAVDVHIPTSILNPIFPPDSFHCPAVVGGNTETSQRLTDTLLKALQVVACSQGTMNNLLFGNENFGYYETIGGGAGAGNGFDGASAVHTHMTNTRITDPEILEHRYPVRLERFTIRRGSGGKGMWNGGDGICRELTFLGPVSLTVLAQHRKEGPYGLEGGQPGLPGEQYLVKKDGEQVHLQGQAAMDVQPGDRIVLYTPGGGGYGQPK